MQDNVSSNVNYKYQPFKTVTTVTKSTRLKELNLWTLEERCNRADLIGPCLKHAGTPGRRRDSITGGDAGTVATLY